MLRQLALAERYSGRVRWAEVGSREPRSAMFARIDHGRGHVAQHVAAVRARDDLAAITVRNLLRALGDLLVCRLVRGGQAETSTYGRVMCTSASVARSSSWFPKPELGVDELAVRSTYAGVVWTSAAAARCSSWFMKPELVGAARAAPARRTNAATREMRRHFMVGSFRFKATEQWMCILHAAERGPGSSADRAAFLRLRMWLPAAKRDRFDHGKSARSRRAETSSRN